LAVAVSGDGEKEAGLWAGLSVTVGLNAMRGKGHEKEKGMASGLSR
jgi:hypothetical protein